MWGGSSACAFLKRGNGHTVILGRKRASLGVLLPFTDRPHLASGRRGEALKSLLGNRSFKTYGFDRDSPWFRSGSPKQRLLGGHFESENEWREEWPSWVGGSESFQEPSRALLVLRGPVASYF